MLSLSLSLSLSFSLFYAHNQYDTGPRATLAAASSPPASLRLSRAVPTPSACTSGGRQWTRAGKWVAQWLLGVYTTVYTQTSDV